jgi:RNA polymerase sigma-70 factor (ECF subfamily)
MKNGPTSSAFEPNELERQLLEAARADRIPAQLQLRMSEVVLACVPPSAASTSAASRLASLLSTKSGVWGSLTLVALAAGIGFAALQPLLLGPAARPVAPAAPVPAVASGDRPVASGELPQAPAALLLAPARPGAAGLAAAAPLGEELALLDRTREALRDHKPARALTLLERHAKLFPEGGALGPEADVLRIEAWRSSGERERAEQAARRFLKEHPSHPLASHVASLTPPAVH